MRDTRCKYEVGDIIPKIGTPKDYEYLIYADGSTFDASYDELRAIFTNGKVPNLTDGRFLEGSTQTRIERDAGLPNITGSMNAKGAVALQNLKGAFYTAGSLAGEAVGGSVEGPVSYKFDASRSNPIYGASDTVQPKSYTVKYYICYGG